MRLKSSVAAGASAALIAIVALAAPAAAIKKPPEDFRAIAKITSSEPNGKRLLIKEKLKVDGKAAGKAKLKLVFGKDRSTISGTWKLDAGTIKGKGRLKKSGKTTLVSIKKGTGLYRGARGKVIIENVTDRRNRESFDFR